LARATAGIPASPTLLIDKHCLRDLPQFVPLSSHHPACQPPWTPENSAALGDGKERVTNRRDECC